MARRAAFIAVVLSVAACTASPGATPSTAVSPSSPAGASPSGGASGPAAVAQACSPDNSPKIQAIKDQGVLKWATGIFAPYAYKDPQGNYQGIEIDNAKEFASILGVKAEVKDYSYEVIVPTVQTGEADIIGAGLLATDARREVIDFSDSYYRSGQIFVVLANRAELTSFDDLNKSEITYVGNIGWPGNDLAKEYLPNAKQNLLTGSGDFQNLYPQLQSGQADVFLTDDFIWPAAKAAFPDLKAIGRRGVVTDEVPISEDVIGEIPISFGIAKGDGAYLACVNAWVADITSSGRFVARFREWVQRNAAGQ